MKIDEILNEKSLSDVLDKVELKYEKDVDHEYFSKNGVYVMYCFEIDYNINYDELEMKMNSLSKDEKILLLTILISDALNFNDDVNLSQFLKKYETELREIYNMI